MRGYIGPEVYLMNLGGFSIRAFDLWIPAVSQMLVLFTIGVVPCCSCCNGVFRCCCHKQTTCCCSFGRVFRHDCVCVLAVVFRFLDGVWMGSSLHLWPIIHQCERRRAAQCCSAAEIVFLFFQLFFTALRTSSSACSHFDVGWSVYSRHFAWSHDFNHTWFVFELSAFR